VGLRVSRAVCGCALELYSLMLPRCNIDGFLLFAFTMITT
jgi:hypothetical protein